MSYIRLPNQLIAWLVFAASIVLTSTAPAIGQVDRGDDQAEDSFRASDFPYQALVRSSDAAVYSGPAAVHYATEELRSGKSVTVYRHDPNGWCAIEPPMGSFSLIPEAAVEKVSDNVGVLIQDHVQAWVGTRLGSVDKPLWQVKLNIGEEVEIVGEASWPSPEGHSTIWYQISPPAGEFRWVKRSDLQLPSVSSRSLPSDQSLTFDQRQTSNAFTEVDLEVAPYIDRALNVGQERSPSRNSSQARQAKNSPAGFVYKSEQKNIKSMTPRDPPKPPVLKPSTRAPTRQLAVKSDTPKRDDNGIDFKFRPIGKAASGSKRPSENFAGQAQPGSPQRATVVNSDDIQPPRSGSEVVQATFQSPDPVQGSSGQWKPATKAINRAVNNAAQRAGDRFAERRTGFPQRPSSLLDDSINKFENRDKPFGGRSAREHGDLDEIELQWDEPSDKITNSRFDGHVSQEEFDSRQPLSRRSQSLQSVPRAARLNKLTPQLSKLEMALTNEMLKRPNEWQLSDLQLNVEQIYAQTPNPVERLQAQRIIDKIKKCKQIRSGYAQSFHARGETFGSSLPAELRNRRPAASLDTVGGAPDGLARARARLDRFAQAGPFRASTLADVASSSGPDNLVGTGVNTDVELGARYDAYGWLTELVSEDRNNRPVYVLVNDEGKITHHVAPSPGLNLHRYLKSKVGVNGRQGFNNVLKLSHVTVNDVSELIQRR